MKKQFAVLAFILFYSIAGYTQVYKPVILDKMEMLSVRASRDKKFADGSPYVNAAFLPAKVNDIIGNAPMRYNGYNDSFEFISTKKDTLVLDKKEEFNNITFLSPSRNYQLVDYFDAKGNKIYGYLIKVREKNDFILYKRQRVHFTEAKQASSSYDTDKPAKFSPMKDTYFLKNQADGIIELPTNKKGIVKLLAAKKPDLEAFIKQNNIDVDEEQDLIKLIDFLGQ